jgi:hypothetical protein
MRIMTMAGMVMLMAGFIQPASASFVSGVCLRSDDPGHDPVRMEFWVDVMRKTPETAPRIGMTPLCEDSNLSFGAMAISANKKEIEIYFNRAALDAWLRQDKKGNIWLDATVYFAVTLASIFHPGMSEKEFDGATLIAWKSAGTLLAKRGYSRDEVVTFLESLPNANYSPIAVQMSSKAALSGFDSQITEGKTETIAKISSDAAKQRPKPEGVTFTAFGLLSLAMDRVTTFLTALGGIGAGFGVIYALHRWFRRKARSQDD